MGKLIIIIVEFMLIRPCRRLYGNWAHFQKWWNRNVHTLFAECTRLCIKCCTQHSSTASTFSQESVFTPCWLWFWDHNCHFETTQVTNFFFLISVNKLEILLSLICKDLKCFKESVPMHMLQYYLIWGIKLMLLILYQRK